MEIDVIGHAWRFLTSGGPVMIALFGLSLLLYKNVAGLLLFVLRSPLDNIEMEFEPRVALPAAGGRTRNPVLRKGDWERKEFEETRARFRNLVQTRLKYTHALVMAAPLLGLLGTVMGMLYSFHGLSMLAGHETAKWVADGVSRALVTTQTGLTIAIPALFFTQWINQITRKQEQRFLERRILRINTGNGK